MMSSGVVLEPSWSDFKDLNMYVSSILHQIEANGAVCIKPPPEWEHLKACDLDQVLNWKVTPASYSINKSTGEVDQGTEEMDVRSWIQRVKKMSDKDRFQRLESLDSQNQTKWESAFVDVQYCTDVEEKTLFSPKLKEWNLNKLPDYYNTKMRAIPLDITGSTSPTMFVAEMGSPFYLHTEEMNLYSTIYVHMGEPKIWYTIKSTFFDKVCEVYTKLAPGFDCDKLWCHKVAFPSVNNKFLKGIPIQKIEQPAGHFVIVGPKVFHWGYNKGFNVSEGCHFGPKSWIPMGHQFSGCPGHKDVDPETEPTMTIDMDQFMSEDEESEEEEEDNEEPRSTKRTPPKG